MSDRSMARGAALTGLLVFGAASAASAQVVRISVSTAGSEANGASAGPSTSATGRFVAFESVATNLIAADTNGATDIVLRDRDTVVEGAFYWTIDNTLWSAGSNVLATRLP